MPRSEIANAQRRNACKSGALLRPTVHSNVI